MMVAPVQSLIPRAILPLPVGNAQHQPIQMVEVGINYGYRW
jgi:hypothetical protein